MAAGSSGSASTRPNSESSAKRLRSVAAASGCSAHVRSSSVPGVVCATIASSSSSSGSLAAGFRAGSIAMLWWRQMAQMAPLPSVPARWRSDHGRRRASALPA
jgi:hypothetical protein